MKNRIHLVRFTILFGIIVCTSCKEINKNQQQEQPTEKPTIVDAPPNIITLQQADAIYTNYSEHRIPLIENYETIKRAPSDKFEAARFVDFDYETIKKYLAYIDQEAANAGVKKVTKLRMYFANYPDKRTFEDGKDIVHPRQNSLFLLPTLEKDGGNYSFYIGDDGKAKLIIDWKDDQLQKGLGTVLKKSKKARASLLPNFFTKSELYSGKSLILNRSGSGPPPKTEF